MPLFYETAATAAMVKYGITTDGSYQISEFWSDSSNSI